MNFCTKCGAQLNDTDTFCTNCGAPVEAAQQQAHPVQQVQQPVYQQQVVYVKAPNDHTDEFTAEDISANKITAMCGYILGVLGVLIALLAGNTSPYCAFHVREALKLTMAEVLVLICSVFLCWTIIVPFAGIVCAVIIYVVRIICFFQVCSGKAKNAPIIGSLPFFK